MDQLAKIVELFRYDKRSVGNAIENAFTCRRLALQFAIEHLARNKLSTNDISGNSSNPNSTF